MDIQRNLLTISLVAISAILYFKWIDYSAIGPVVTQSETQTVTSVPSVGSQANTNTSAAPETNVPRISEVIDIPNTTGAQETTLITVTTDLVVATINTKGGVIERLELRKHLAEIDDPNIGFALLKKESNETFIAEDGLTNSSQDAPNHFTQYEYSQTTYDIGSDNSVLVELTWVADNGVTFVKSLTFTRDSYVVDIDYKVNNNSNATWNGYLYGHFTRTIPENSGGGFGRLPSYTGAVYHFEGNREKVDFDDMIEEDLSLKIQGGWVAMLQHYFVGAWIPGKDTYKYYTDIVDPRGQKDKADYLYSIGFNTTEATSVLAGQSGNVGTQVYLGPKEQSRLKLLEREGVEDIALTVDYGFLTFIADPLFTVLSWIHDVVGNWGWAIILLTILIKLMFYPLSAASYRSMGKMKKLQPRMATLKERYKDDRQKFQVEMMAMYKKEKVNPAGGCLPILVQIPVFIALYWVLLESVEMRHAPFALWWVDLSAKDPYYVLPVLMGLSMFFMQKLNPAPMDDIQKKVMMIMPFALTFLFMTFPQGLVLYWVVNNVLTMAQQWFNYRQQDKKAKTK
jgi:YidC/Oxa1 family membrane protein insertase